MLVPVRHAISDTSVHAYNKFYIIVGRKPHPGEQWETKAPGDAGDADLAADTEMSDVS